MMPRGCMRNFTLLVVVVVVATVVALTFLFSQQMGLLSFLGTPTYQNRAVVVLDSVQKMSVLTTTRYNFSSIITSEREMPPLLAALYGERQVLVAVGHVTAGIDLTQLTENDITIAGNTLTINLPPPTLQDCFLNEGASYVAERDTGIFARSAPNLEGQAREFAIGQFRQQAMDGGILAEVQRQSQVAIGEFIAALGIPGVTQINVTTAPPDSATLPMTCQ